MYKKITIIQELKKEFVIVKGEELLIGLNRNVKKYDDWKYDVGTKEDRTIVVESDEYERELVRWRKLDKINREELAKIEKTKLESRAKAAEPNFKKEDKNDEYWETHWSCSKCNRVFSKEDKIEASRIGLAFYCNNCFIEHQKTYKVG